MCSKASGIWDLVYVWLETSLQSCASIFLSEKKKQKNKIIIVSTQLQYNDD